MIFLALHSEHLDVDDLSFAAIKLTLFARNLPLFVFPFHGQIRADFAVEISKSSLGVG